jgi:hypothetical protein
MNWYTESCPICSGSLHDDLYDKGRVSCFSCGRSFNPNDVRAVDLARPELVEVEDAPEDMLVEGAA